MGKKIVIILGVVILVLLAVLFFVPEPSRNNENQATENPNFKAFNLKPGQIIQSPLVVLGEAKLWYFEGSFPVKIEDANGIVLAQAPAQALGEWMTEDFVSFKVEVEFDPPATKKGFVVFEEDNPSGMQDPESVKIPIVFKNFVESPMELEVFFSNPNLDPEITCDKVFPVTRIVPKAETPARSALESLLRGPTIKEAKEGYATSLNTSGIKIQKLVIKDGLAEVDFSSDLEAGVGGSCRVTAIRAQIKETLKQFPTVSSVKISIDGRTEDILQP